jgi:hypothetical protein
MPTLYQCFFTLPSVRCGNVYRRPYQLTILQEHGSPLIREVPPHLCNLAPAVPSISHLFQPQFFSGRPRRICPTLFGLGLLRSIDISHWRQHGTARLGVCTICSPSHLVLRLSEGYRLALSARRGWQWRLSASMSFWIRRSE